MIKEIVVNVSIHLVIHSLTHLFNNILLSTSAEGILGKVNSMRKAEGIQGELDQFKELLVLSLKGSVGGCEHLCEYRCGLRNSYRSNQKGPCLSFWGVQDFILKVVENSWNMLSRIVTWSDMCFRKVTQVVIVWIMLSKSKDSLEISFKWKTVLLTCYRKTLLSRTMRESKVQVI